MLISIFLKRDLRTFFGNWKDLESTNLIDLGIVLFDFVFIFSNVKLLLIQLIIRGEIWQGTLSISSKKDGTVENV